jgi:membrane protein YqaA with SNARE-associated domain
MINAINSSQGHTMIRKLYNWMFSLAQSRHASKALAGFSFAESSFFPIPPDVLLIPMVLARRDKWLQYALLCTVASILGAFAGYAIGALGYEFIGKPILAFYGKEDLFVRMQNWFDTWGGWGLMFAAITPFPYKVLTISSGFAGLNLIMFTLVSIVGRGFRFFLVAFLLHKFGEPIQKFIEKRLNILFVVGMVLLVGGFVAVKYIG